LIVNLSEYVPNVHGSSLLTRSNSTNTNYRGERALPLRPENWNDGNRKIFADSFR
jgi:hypothetical protein